jgi:hypothetical protein
MLEVDLKKITAPDFTISVRPSSPSLVVTNEGTIPQAYWQPRDPRLDRLGLLNDLKRGVVVEGAALSNPAEKVVDLTGRFAVGDRGMTLVGEAVRIVRSGVSPRLRYTSLSGWGTRIRT